MLGAKEVLSRLLGCGGPTADSSDLAEPRSRLDAGRFDSSPNLTDNSIGGRGRFPSNSIQDDLVFSGLRDKLMSASSMISTAGMCEALNDIGTHGKNAACLVPAILDVCNKHSLGHVHIAALQALARIGVRSEEVDVFVRARVQDEFFTIRTAAVTAFGALALTDEDRALLQSVAASDRKPEVRQAAGRALIVSGSHLPTPSFN